jgi:hypothetical protein
MFGFRGGESAATVERKRGYMLEAQERWPFLTNFDASTIKNERQLVTMVKERRSLTESEAEDQVHQWMGNKVF